MLEVLREKREIEKNCEGQIMWSYGKDVLDINNDNQGDINIVTTGITR